MATIIPLTTAFGVYSTAVGLTPLIGVLLWNRVSPAAAFLLRCSHDNPVGAVVLCADCGHKKL